MNNYKKSFLHSISPLRLTIYSLLFSCILITSTLYTLVQQNHRCNEVMRELEKVAFLAQKEAIKESEREGIRKFYRKSDRNYLQNQLESLSFLQDELKALTKLLNAPGFCGNKGVENRITFLTTPLNQIKLREHPLYTSSHIKEVEVELTHPIEISLADLEEILKIIESHDPAKPLIQLSHFHLKRKQPIDQNEVFEIHFKILKREFFDL